MRLNDVQMSECAGVQMRGCASVQMNKEELIIN